MTLRKMALRPFGSRRVVIGGADSPEDQLKAVAYRGEEIRLEVLEEVDALKAELARVKDRR